MQQRTCRWRRHSEPFLHHMPSSLSPAWPRSRPTGSSILELQPHPPRGGGVGRVGQNELFARLYVCWETW